jgi:hypothetical protein
MENVITDIDNKEANKEQDEEKTDENTNKTLKSTLRQVEGENACERAYSRGVYQIYPGCVYDSQMLAIHRRQNNMPQTENDAEALGCDDAYKVKYYEHGLDKGLKETDATLATEEKQNIISNNLETILLTQSKNEASYKGEETGVSIGPNQHEDQQLGQ